MDRRETRLAYSTGGEKETDEEPAPERTGARRLSVGLEKRPSDRVVTLLRGLPPGEEKAIARALKTSLSTGGTIKGSTLELQGDHREGVEAWLRSHLKKRPGGKR